MTICQSELESEDAIYTVGKVVEIGMGGVNGYVVLDERENHASGGVGRGDTLDAAEDEGVVGDNEIGMKGDGFVDDVGGKVYGDKRTGVFGVGVAEKKAGIVVILLIFGVELVVEEMDDFG